MAIRQTTMPTSGRTALSAARLATVGLAAAAITTGVLPAAAFADPPLTATQAQAKVDDLSHQVEVVGEQYNAGEIALTDANRAREGALAAVAQQSATVEEQQRRIGGFAANAYRDGVAGPAAMLLSVQDPESFIDRSRVLGRVSREQAAALTAMRVARQQLERQQADAEDAGRRAADLVNGLESKKREVEVLLDQQQQVLGRLQAQQRTQLEAQRAAEAAAAGQRGDQARQAVAATEVSRGPAVPATEVSRGPAVPATPAAGGASAVGLAAVRAAMTRLGMPYVWGAAGPGSFDCSGLTMWAYSQVGIGLPHYTGAQFGVGRRVPLSALEPGDLVFFGADLGHMGMYVGDGLMIAAPRTGDVVKISPLYTTPVGAVRVVG